jgi:hypothetical protein
MDVIHFTRGATDPLTAFDAHGVGFLPLTDGSGNPHLGCAHLDPGATIAAPSLTHAVTLRVVHGRVTLSTKEPETRLDLSGGVGAILQKGEGYSLTGDIGAILLILEADQLSAHPRGISSPDRIAGQSWPIDPPKAV